MIRIKQLDHLVLTVADIEAACNFYQALGMEREVFAGDQVALRFGSQKINLHQHGHEIKPNAKHAAPGTADLCFICHTSLEMVQQTLLEKNIAIELGIVERTGANGFTRSLYVRDPDGNLIELSNYLD